MKRIMVPTDFSDHSRNAAYYGVELAKKLHANLTLFHAFTLSPSTVYPPLYSTGLPGSPMMQEEVIKAEKESKQRLEAFRDIIMKDKKTPCCNIVQRGGFVSEGINDFAEEKEFDLIVMSTRGSDSVSDYFIATNTWEVIRSGHTTVMAIPEHIPFCTPDHFAFATDFTDTDFDSLNTILTIAGKFKARVSVVHIKTREETSKHDDFLLDQFEKKVRSSRPYDNLDFIILEDSNVQNALNEFIRTNNVKVLAMVNRKYKILKNLFHKSLCKKFAYHSEVPLMVFNQQKSEKKQKSEDPQLKTARKTLMADY